MTFKDRNVWDLLTLVAAACTYTPHCVGPVDVAKDAVLPVAFGVRLADLGRLMKGSPRWMRVGEADPV